MKYQRIVIMKIPSRKGTLPISTRHQTLMLFRVVDGEVEERQEFFNHEGNAYIHGFTHYIEIPKYIRP